MTQNRTPPEFRKDGFDCPYCRAFAHQEFVTLTTNFGNRGKENIGFEASRCGRCGKVALWRDKALVYPPTVAAPLPNPDMPDAVKSEFGEARRVLSISPRSAAALLRLSIQKLCMELGESGKNLDTDIGNLVKKGLSERIQKALDIVRVIGNNAVHPGQIDLKDDDKTAEQLFELVNLTVDVMISEPKRIDELYAKLPPGAKEHIEKRDGPKP